MSNEKLRIGNPNLINNNNMRGKIEKKGFKNKKL